MNKQHTELLFTRFSFFGQSHWGHLPFMEAVKTSVMPFGFECGDGWFPLILKLCEDLEPLVDNRFEVTQVKEKYGGLRFYYYGIAKDPSDNERIVSIVAAAEEKSYETCEICGRKAKQRGRGWISTECWRCWWPRRVKQWVRYRFRFIVRKLWRRKRDKCTMAD